VYDAKRTLRILGEDGSGSTIQVDPEQQKGFQKVGSLSIYNLQVGTFDVSVAAGPSYTTKRQEGQEFVSQLVQSNPAMWQTHGDLIMKMQDMPYAEEFAERSKLTLPPPIQQAIAQQEQGNEQDPQVQMITQQANQMLGQAHQQIQGMGQALQQLQAENAQLKQQAASKMIDSTARAATAETQQYVAETERMQVLAPVMDPQAIQMIVRQAVTEILNAPDPMTAAAGMKPPNQAPPVMAPMAQPQQPPAQAGF
jgi:hypothetical protein